MDRHQITAEDRAEQLAKLVTARTDAIEADILLGRKPVIDNVIDRLEGVECEREEAAALIKAAIIGRSWLVGVRIAAAVQYAIYAVALPLAEGDVADMERSRAESRDENRIAMAEADRAAA
jgi:hypothetical protein